MAKRWRSLRNFERVYRSSRWFQQRFTAVGRIVILALLVSGVLGFDTTRNLSFQVFSVLLAIVFLAMLFSRFNRGQFQCQRSVPLIATVGQAFSYTVNVYNQTNSVQTDVFMFEKLEDCFPNAQELAQFQDEIGKNENWYDRKMGFLRWTRLIRIKTGADAPYRWIGNIAPQQKVQMQINLTPLRRGYLHFTGSRIGCPDPSGLFRSLYDTENSDSILVLPKRYALPHLKLSGHRTFHQGGIALSSSVGESCEFYGLREYQMGDPLRRIHWRSWARQGKPMVKTYEDEFFVRHALILDTYAQHVGNEVFEEAVSVAASAAMDIGTQESLLDLIFVEGKAYQFTSGRGLADIQSVLEILACVQPECRSGFESLQNMVLQHVPQLSSAIFIFVDWDQARRNLLNAVKEFGIQPIVFLIVEPGHALLAKNSVPDYPEVHLLTTGQIESSLQKIA